MENNIYYINVDVRGELYYPSEVFISNELPSFWVEMSEKYYKVKVKNEKYLDNYLQTGNLFKVYASNLIYMED